MQDFRDIPAASAISGATEYQRRATRTKRVFDRTHSRILAHDQDIGVVGEVRRRAEPSELARIEPDIGIAAEEPKQWHVAGDQAEGGAILGREIVEIVGRDQAAGARHVLYDDGRIAGDIPADMARQQATKDVEAASRPIADHERNGFALVELFDGLRARGLSRERGGRETRGDPSPEHLQNLSADPV